MMMMMETPLHQRKSPWEHCCMSPLAQACKPPLEPAQLLPDHHLNNDDDKDVDDDDDGEYDDDDRCNSLAGFLFHRSTHRLFNQVTLQI